MEKATWPLKITLLLVSSLTIMSIITISPALPEMTKNFGEVPNSDFLVKMVLTIPALMIAMVAPIAGRLIDKYGRLGLLRSALVLYAVAGTAGFFLDNLYQILLSRAILGAAVGLSMTIVITLVADYFEGMERQKFAGIQVAFMSLGGILFIGLGGLLADIGWRFPFLIYSFALLVLPLTYLFLKEPGVAKKAATDLSNVKPPKIIWLFFVNTMLLWLLFFLIPVQIPFFLKSLGVEKNALVGIAIATSTAFSAVSSISFSKIKNRFSFLSIFGMGYLLMAAGFFCISIAHSYLLVLLGLVLSGLGMGLMIPNTNVWIMKVIPPAIRGKEIGKLTTFWFLGQFLSPIILLPLVSRMELPSVFLFAALVLGSLSLGFFVFNKSKQGEGINK